MRKKPGPWFRAFLLLFMLTVFVTIGPFFIDVRSSFFLFPGTSLFVLTLLAFLLADSFPRRQ